MFLTSSSAVFKIALAGQSASLASLTFEAMLLDTPSTVAFCCSAGITPNVNGNEVTVTDANFAPASATITVEGVQYTQVASLAKVANGADGAPGARSNVEICADSWWRGLSGQFDHPAAYRPENKVR